MAASTRELVAGADLLRDVGLGGGLGVEEQGVVRERRVGAAFDAVDGEAARGGVEERGRGAGLGLFHYGQDA